MVQLNGKDGECSWRRPRWDTVDGVLGVLVFYAMRCWEHLRDVSISALMGHCCFAKVNTESFTCNPTYANTNTLVFADCWKRTEGMTEVLKHSCWMNPNSPSVVLHGRWALRGCTCRRIRSVSGADVTQAFSSPCSSSSFQRSTQLFSFVHILIGMSPYVHNLPEPELLRNTFFSFFFFSFIHLFCPMRAS